jgi:hypothetical protein
MQLIHQYSAGNREARIYYASISGYSVEYLMNNQSIKKTYHTNEELAEQLAEDFISEGGSNPTLLNE